MKRETIFMETTEVSAKRSAALINEMLGEAGASQVLNEYSAGKITTINFMLFVGGRELPFRLPVRTPAVLKMMRDRRKRHQLYADDEEKAERIAWRQAFRWLEAQLAFCQTGMVEMQEVFLPYLMLDAKTTVYQRLQERGYKMLPEPPRGGEA